MLLLDVVVVDRAITAIQTNAVLDLKPVGGDKKRGRKKKGMGGVVRRRGVRAPRARIGMRRPSTGVDESKEGIVHQLGLDGRHKRMREAKLRMVASKFVAARRVTWFCCVMFARPIPHVVVVVVADDRACVWRVRCHC